MAAPRVLIVGGGIAGLTLAIALRRRAMKGEVVEPRPKGTLLGVGISLPDPTRRALKPIGLVDRGVAAGFGFDRILFADAAGRQVGPLAMPRLCGPDHPAT